MKRTIIYCAWILLGNWLIAGDSWPQYLGPERDGSVAAPGLFGADFTLERVWIEPLGSGFSGIVVADGKLYTMHTAGDKDAMSSFDAATGKKRWSYAYGASFPKIGSSEPGPLSTPIVDGNRVYGLGAQGELFCVSTENGKLIWSRNIVEELGAIPREVGIASSPLIVGNSLILNVGDQKDKSVAAFNKMSGVLSWHVGSEKVSFQSPALANFAGRAQVVAQSANKLRGLEPSTGNLLWEYDTQEWIQSYQIGPDLLLSGHYHGMVLHQINNLGFLSVRELWNNQNLTIEYAMPIHHQGYLFGTKGNILSCLNLTTGDKVWSTREAGQHGMIIAIDGHLAIYNNDGELRIARAWEKGYDERASIKVFEKGGLITPSFADGVFYVRNYTHLAAVKVK